MKSVNNVKFKLSLIILIVAVISGQSLAFAHGGIEHNTDDAVIMLYQKPLSPVIREKVKTAFIFNDKNGDRLTNMPVQLTLIDTHENNAAKDKTVLVKNIKTDVNGILYFDYRYAKPDYYDIDLDFKVNDKLQDTGFLLQIRNPYKNWFSLTYLVVFVIGISSGWYIANRRYNKAVIQAKTDEPQPRKQKRK